MMVAQNQIRKWPWENHSLDQGRNWKAILEKLVLKHGEKGDEILGADMKREMKISGKGHMNMKEI